MTRSATGVTSSLPATLVSAANYEFLAAPETDLNRVQLWRFQLPGQMAELEAHLVEGKIDLLVIDPFAAHLGGGVSRHSDNIRAVLNPLTELLEATKCACIIIEHALKRVPIHGDPLNAIGGYTDLLSLGLGGPVTPQQAEYIERIRRSQQHLMGVITDLLNFSRIEAGQVTYEISPVELSDVIEAVVRRFGTYARLVSPEFAPATKADNTKR